MRVGLYPLFYIIGNMFFIVIGSIAHSAEHRYLS